MPGLYWRLREFLVASNRQPNNIIAGKEGLYEVRDNIFGRIVLKKPVIPFLDDISEGFEFVLPRIPAELLSNSLSFFRAYCTEDEENEVMLQIFYDTHSGEYELECPVQRVDKVSIHTDTSQRFNNPRYVQVMHLHSHNSMPAYFSPVDNRDELKYMLYGVVGNLSDEAEMKLRVGAGGQFIALPIEYIFEQPDLNANGQYPKEWHQLVETAVMRERV